MYEVEILNDPSGVFPFESGATMTRDELVALIDEPVDPNLVGDVEVEGDEMTGARVRVRRV